MLKRAVILFVVIIFAFLILLISVLKSAAVRYEFNTSNINVNNSSAEDSLVDYELAYPGKVLPTSFLWPLKAGRDKLWLILTTNLGRKSELNLLFADKRLGASRELFVTGKSETAFSTLVKAEAYLEDANTASQRNNGRGADTSEFDSLLTKATIKHFEEMTNILEMAPENAKPKIEELLKTPIRVYERARERLYQKGINPPDNPLNW